MKAILSAAAVVFVANLTALAQNTPGGLKGQVRDPSGAVVPAAAVTVTGTGGTVKATETNQFGQFAISGLPPGKYAVRALAKGFAVYEEAVETGEGKTATLDIRLSIILEKQQVTVADQAHVDVDPASNAGALILRGEDLDALSDDPDDLASDLQALAGPAAGPNGGQIFIDGFTGGRLPPQAIHP